MRWNVGGFGRRVVWWPRAQLLVLCMLLGCGRVGVKLLPILDAGTATEAGSAPEAGTAPMLCEDPSSVDPRAICGCGASDLDDRDLDGVPDCIDFCPNGSDRAVDGSCNCAAAGEDADGDGTPNCSDRCPFDANKHIPGMCGCGVSDDDADEDGVPNCLDECSTDPGKSARGLCGCGVPEEDTDLDGTPDCMDRCSGREDVVYQSADDCGVGYCRAHNIPGSCRVGMETDCRAGAPLSAADTICDAVDDDCDGMVDEDYVPQSKSCGVGVCQAMGQQVCQSGMIVDRCTPAAALSSNDATCDARDDDCDGRVDENVMAMVTTCSVGACAAMGSNACVNGRMVDSCEANMPMASTDTLCDNLDEDCDGRVDEEYVVQSTTCGLGACRRMGGRTCVNGASVDSCRAANASTSTDSTCNNVDDDCDGRVDENFAPSVSSCGTGACIASGMRTCSAGVVSDSCRMKTPTTMVDDATVPGNGIDDDCDGTVDEDVPPCDTTARTYEVGSHTLSIPGNCKRVTVRLWGGGGAGGQSAGLSAGGEGGPGGYASATVLVASPILLHVGGAAASGCNNAGTNAGSSSYNGGTGGTSTGANGADGAVSGGGSGGQPSSGAAGGNGYYGGGGGGQGSGGFGASGNGGGGGAASVLLVNGTRAAVAGGGGGGGGAQAITVLGSLSAAGGNGGSGCRGNGQAPNANGGGGGGGGMCSGATTQAGSGSSPAFSGDIPSGRARGGASSCGAAGAGYAIVTFAP